MAHQTQLALLIDGLNPFNASVDAMIVVARKGEPDADHTFSHLTVMEKAPDDLSTRVKTHGIAQPQHSLSADGWTLTRPEALRLLEKLRANGTPLGDYVGGAIYYGIKTGYNEAFVIDRATRDRLIAEDARSAEIIKPFLRGRDIKRWRVDFAEQYLIFTRRGIDIEQYPAIKRHLLQYKDRLMPGAAGGRKAGSYKWYEIQDNIAYYAEFEKPKIVYPDIAKTFQFALDSVGSYIGNTAYMILTDDLFLLGILNSSLSHFYFVNLSANLGSQATRSFNIYMQRVPVPNAPQALRERIGALAKQLSALRGQGAAAAALEDELNALVYQAYGLEPSEIALIEAALKE